MADDVENDDQWLYGDAPELQEESEKHDEDTVTPPEATPEVAPPAEEITTEEKAEPELPATTTTTAVLEHPQPVLLPPPDIEDPEQSGLEEGEHVDDQNGDGSDKEDTDDDSDDDVNVVIGDIKASPAYTSLNIKRGGLLTSTVTDKSKQPLQQSGKFIVEEFEQMGMINGVSAADYNLDSLEEKPWRKPGADITDYFNYGFNEDTWKAYCERQKRLRVNESGVGLVPLNAIGLPRGPVPIMNDNSKYSGSFTGIRKAGPPPGRRMTGAIDVIGGAAQTGSKVDAPKENVIQVMTADRREYSRKPPGFPDMSMPPPTTFEEFQPEFGFNPEPEPFYGGYEPTQDLQWGKRTGVNPNWTPNEIKSLTPGPGIVPSPVPPVTTLGPPMAPPMLTSPPPSRRGSKERDRESRSRSEKPPKDRERERSRRRDRSRSRSRRHKSRSRSPSHRHRKKKSRRHEDSE